MTPLPTLARGPVCSVRWWQPVHSGAGRDVWAVDDVTLADTIYNMLWLDFSHSGLAAEAVSVHHGKIGPHCGRPSVLM